MNNHPPIPSHTPVRNPDSIKLRLKELHDTFGLSWREIAQLPEFSGIPSGTLCAIAKGYPVPKKWRHHFGLPPVTEIQCAIGQSVVPGALVLSSQDCVMCSKPYIANHPRRKKCFECSPYRGNPR